jgi:DNA-binding CsgD family transcriptional regulator
MTSNSAVSYSINLIKTMNKICEPLVKHLNIECCSYVRVYEDGAYLLMSNTFEEYIKKYMCDVRSMSQFFKRCLKSAAFYRSNYSMWPRSAFYECPVEKICAEFGVVYDFSIIYRTRNFVEKFSFGMKCSMQDKTEFYIGNIFLLDEFVNYFRIKAKDFIDITDKSFLGVYDEKANFNSSSFLTNEESFLECLQDVGVIIANAFGDSVVLSKREAQCLRLMCQGKVSKEVAAELNISPRTVEYHFSQIRQKTLLNRKSQLVSSYLKSRKYPYVTP